MNHLRAEVIICPNVLLEDWGHYDTNSTQALISLKIWTASQPVTFLHVHHVSMQRLWNAAFWSLFFAIIPIIWKRSWSLFYWLKLLILNQLRSTAPWWKFEVLQVGFSRGYKNLSIHPSIVNRVLVTEVAAPAGSQNLPEVFSSYIFSCITF